MRSRIRARSNLVLQPGETGDPFTVELAAGTYAVEWHSVNTRETLVGGGKLTVLSNGSRSFTSPFVAAPSVLYLKEVSS